MLNISIKAYVSQLGDNLHIYKCRIKIRGDIILTCLLFKDYGF